MSMKAALAEARAMVTAFLETPFSHAERHQRRIDMLLAYEADRSLPALPH